MALPLHFQVSSVIFSTCCPDLHVSLSAPKLIGPSYSNVTPPTVIYSVVDLVLSRLLKARVLSQKTGRWDLKATLPSVADRHLSIAAIVMCFNHERTEG